LCDVDKIFWNVCVGQLERVHDGGQFKRCSLYLPLRFQEILLKPIIIIWCIKCIPFLIGDATYPICNYLQKNWKTCNLIDVDKIKYDFNMNLKKVVMENAFGSLKNNGEIWNILTLELIKHHQL